MKSLADLRPPYFRGETDPAVLEAYISDLETAFDTLNPPAEVRVRLAAFYLKGAAQDWWKLAKIRPPGAPDYTWEEYVTLLREKYYPAHIRTKKRLELESLRQTGMTVDEYFTRFTALLRLLPGLGYSDQLLVERFYGGLSYRLRYGMGPATFTTLQVLS